VNLFYRKLYRGGGIVFPLIYYFTTKKFTLILLSTITILVVTGEILRFQLPYFNERIFKYCRLILKEREKGKISGTTYFLIGALLTILFFEKGIAITALTFSVVGDAISAITGVLIGKVKGKSLEGSVACFILCLITGIILSYANLGINIKLSFWGALAATVGEALPLGINDNLTMPIFTGLIMKVAKTFKLM